MIKKMVSIIVACMVLASASSANAALAAYMTLTGAKSGAVRGGVTQKGREGSIAIIAMDHDIVSPRDPQSGLPTGQRLHKPLKITMELDQATPILYRMLTTNENITKLELRFWRASPTGMEVQYYTVRLTNASISDIRTVMPNVKSVDGARAETFAEVSFVYQKIDWTWTDGGISAEDDWRAKS